MEDLIVNYNKLYTMKKIIATLSLVFALTLSINASAQTRTISVEIATLDGSSFDRCVATVQIKKPNRTWKDDKRVEVYGVTSFTLSLTLHRDSTFRVMIKARQDQIENTNYSKEYLMGEAPNLVRLLIDFRLTRTNYVLLEEGDEGY